MPTGKTLIKNYIFNLLKILMNLLFPLITFTYSTRILGVEGVGEVSFTKSFITYFTMLAMLGMNYYGTREAAKLRDDLNRFSKFVHEMLMINACSTIAAYCLLAIVMLTVRSLDAYRELLLINSVAIVLQGMGMEWMYQAVEEYRYIAVRSILFQVIAFIALLIFVREANDVIPYTVVSLIATSGSYILNFLHAHKFVRFRRYEHYEFRKHLQPLLWLFAMIVSIEFYTVLDTTMLGFIIGDAAVGRYTAAIKVNKMTITLILAINIVLLPRLAYYVEREERERLNKLVKQAYRYVSLLSIPAAVGLFMLSDEIIFLLSGHEFASAAVTMRIMTPIVILIPFSSTTNQQTLVPLGLERRIMISTICGAIVNFTCNFFLIPRYAENGAAIATVLSEGVVAAICYYNANRLFDMKVIFKPCSQYWLASIEIPMIVTVFYLIPMHFVLRMLVIILMSVTAYCLTLLILKNESMIQIINTLKKGAN